MKISYTLLTDGSSDRALMPVLNWLIRDLHARADMQANWADLFRLPIAPSSLAERIERSIELYPCDLLFVHRDAETASLATRKDEIARALEQAQKRLALPPAVCVSPIRMQEAWLLFDEPAIRRAAGNPHGSQRLALPKLKTVESLPDPKEMLYECLRTASGLSGRHLRKFRERSVVHRVADLIEDFAPLRKLSAFRVLEKDLAAVLNHHY